MSLRYEDAEKLRERYYREWPCTCEAKVMFCPSCLELQRLHARQGWRAVAVALGDDVPPQRKRGCCGG